MIYIDFETKSDVDLKTAGAYKYFASPHADALIASYSTDGQTVKRWQNGEPCPDELRRHIEAGGLMHAHNAAFERICFMYVMGPKHGWPVPAIEQWVCSAATAAAMSLPRDLKRLGEALNLSVQKDFEGMRLIRLFCIPRKAKKNEPPGLYWNEPADHPEDFERFREYCDRDVLTEAAADARMVPLSAEEQKLYRLDQKINDRGLRIDTTSAYAALALADKAKAQLDKEMTYATGGYVTACSQVTRMTAWVQSQGITMSSAAKAEIEALLEDKGLPEHIRRVVEIRQEAAKTSVAKLSAFLHRAQDDARIRGSFLYHAAGTGRWSSVGAQLQNLPRPRKIYEKADLDTAALFEAFRSSSPEYLRLLYGDELGRPLYLLSDAIRGFIWSAPGHHLLVADYSGIEGAVAAWFCGESWKVKAITELMHDDTLPDLYRRAAAGIYNTTVDQIPKSDGRRQVGKVSELALQYQGGCGAFYSMAQGYGINMDEVYGPVWEAADGERREAAQKRYNECAKRKERTTEVLSEQGWLAAELIKVGWRSLHPETVGSWRLLQDAVFAAVENPGTVASVLKAKFIVRNGFLWCRLPSGRCLAYGGPRIQEVEVQWADKTVPMAEREKQRAVTALGVNSVTKNWERYPLYGGLLLENIVQAIARDLLVNGIFKAEAAGYPVIGHVHDEIITEIPIGVGDVAEFEKLICELPDWAEGLPLMASGWRGKRYRK